MNTESILKDSIFKVGRVTSVDGRFVGIKVDKEKNSSHLLYKGNLLKNTSVGSYIKIAKGFIDIIGKIEGEHIKEEKNFSNKNYGNEKEKIDRILKVSLFGFFHGNNFEKGIKELPLIDNECFILTDNEFNKIHNFVKEGDEPITIGSLSLEKGQEIKIGVNSLFASHFGIFGNTGSGKSYTLAKIYHELFKKYKQDNKFKNNGTFLLFDFNGEYAKQSCITERKKVYNLTTRKKSSEKIPFKEKDLVDIEFISILATATEKTQKPFLSRTLNFYKKVLSDEDSINYFKNTVKKYTKNILSMTDKIKAHLLIDHLINILEKKEESNMRELLFKKIEWNNKHHYFMIKNKNCKALTDEEIQTVMEVFQIDDYQFPENIMKRIIDFLYLKLIIDIYNNKAQNDHIIHVINRLKSKKEDIEKILDTNDRNNSFFKGNNIIVINLKDVNLEMKKTLPLLLSKKIYMEHKKNHNTSTTKHLNIIIDEAHNILSEESVREEKDWKDYRLEIFEEIIKEGRKFGVFLTIASQRPRDISPTIISQLHNYFLHRLVNNQDIKSIERAITYLDKLSSEYLSILPIGTCVLAGLFTQVPVPVDIGKIEPEKYKPSNETIKLTEHWKN